MAASLAPQSKSKPDPLAAQFDKDVKPLIAKYCLGCHNGPKGMGGVDLAKYKTVEQMTADQKTWDRVAANLRGQVMPPPNYKIQPTDKERERLLAAVETIITVGCGGADPGKATIRRLNKREYNNTVKDLLLVDLSPADDFPSDDIGYGFDTIGDVLTSSPLFTEQVISAAEKLAYAAIVDREPREYTYDPLSFKIDGGINLNQTDTAWFYAKGTAEVSHEFKTTGFYTIRIKAYGQQAGPEVCKMSLSAGNKILATFNVATTSANPGLYEIPFEARVGKVPLQVTFVNDYYDPDNADPTQRDRNLAVMSIQVISPGDLGVLPKSYTNIINIQPIKGMERSAAKPILTKFATRAYRRPVTVAEVDRLLQLFDVAISNGESFESATRLCVTAILSSPHFLYRVELDNKPANAAKPEPIDGFAMASRLSYFLWSTMPDAELFRAAEAGELSKPEGILKQVDRMLASPKINALGDGFAMQWLELERLRTRQPDPVIFSTFSEELRADMLTETRLFFMDFVRNGEPVVRLLDAPYTFANNRLAQHYGLAAPGPQFVKVDLKGTGRAGLLTHASVLTVTSNPTRTSPVKRGKWVLEQILGTPPPAPPPGADSLTEEVKGLTNVSFRKRLEMHRADPACANCHQRMDPLGFGLENFDGIGKWRDQEAGAEVDASGELPGGIKFNGAEELRAILIQKQPEFEKCLTEKLMIYALGRGLRPQDKCYVDEVLTKTRASKTTLPDLIKAIVLTDAFRMKGAGDILP